LTISCSCEEWKDNIYIIVGTLAMAHSDLSKNVSSFEYCPWCGKKLEIKEEEHAY
jgi:hypothetical protein